MRRRSSAADSANLDSLLDTMANVVGILVIILAVTQISVGDAMKRIRAHHLFAAEERELEEDQSRALETRMSALGDQLAKLAPDQAAAEYDGLRRDLRELRENPGALELMGESASQIVAALALETRRAQRLEAHVATSQAQLASLRISLDSMTSTGVAHAVRLPDPRPAPRGTEVAVFFCRYGRTFQVDLESLQAQLGNALQQRSRVFPEIGNRELRWIPIPPHRGRFGWRWGWRSKDAGETSFEIRSNGSAFRSALARLSPERQTLSFYVWSDSFDVYLEARRIAEDAGFLVGWIPYQAQQESDWYQRLENEPEDNATPID